MYIPARERKMSFAWICLRGAWRGTDVPQLLGFNSRRVWKPFRPLHGSCSFAERGWNLRKEPSATRILRFESRSPALTFPVECHALRYEGAFDLSHSSLSSYFVWRRWCVANKVKIIGVGIRVEWTAWRRRISHPSRCTDGDVQRRRMRICSFKRTDIIYGSSA